MDWSGFIICYAPILILAVYSFTDAANIGPFRSFSVHNYADTFTTPELLKHDFRLSDFGWAVV